MSIRIILGLCALFVVALGNPLIPTPGTVNPLITTPGTVDESDESGSGKEPSCPSTFDAAVECPKCDFTINPMGYFADECDPFKYYQCYQVEGGWGAYLRQCANCTVWAQEVGTCIHYPGKCDITVTPDGTVEVIDEDTCRETVTDGQGVTTVFVRQAHENPAKFIVLDTEPPTVMPCAPGTEFNLTTCRCTIVVPVATTPPPAEEIMCIDFDSHSFKPWGFSTSGWQWVSNNGGVSLDPKGVKGKSGYFNGAGKLEIPFFTNNYNHRQFSVSLWYKRAEGSDDTLTMGLLSNGACATGGSLEMYSETGDSAQMRADSEASQISAPFEAKVEPGYWHHIAMVFDFNKVSYFVDNEAPVVVNIAPGKLDNRQCPLSLGVTAQGKFLTGNLDEICLYKTALTNEQVKHLCEDVDQPETNGGNTGATSHR